MAEAQLDQPAIARGAHTPDERLDHARPGAPGDVEARHRVPVPDGAVAAALRPADHRQQPHALLAQPGALLARGEVHVRLRPAPRPLVVGPVEAGGAEPVLPGELVRVADAQAPLLGAVDEEQPAERPERLAAERRLGFLVDDHHPAAGLGQLGGRHEPREAAADDDRVVGVRARHGAAR